MINAYALPLSQTATTMWPEIKSCPVIIVCKIIIIIIIKNEKIRVALCKNAAGALYIVNKMCVDNQRNVQA